MKVRSDRWINERFSLKLTRMHRARLDDMAKAADVSRSALIRAFIKVGFDNWWTPELLAMCDDPKTAVEAIVAQLMRKGDT